MCGKAPATTGTEEPVCGVCEEELSEQVSRAHHTDIDLIRRRRSVAFLEEGPLTRERGEPLEEQDGAGGTSIRRGGGRNDGDRDHRYHLGLRGGV